MLHRLNAYKLRLRPNYNVNRRCYRRFRDGQVSSAVKTPTMHSPRDGSQRKQEFWVINMALGGAVTAAPAGRCL